jgi:hypothetical protein
MLLADLGDYLSSGGCGTLGTDLFRGQMPPTPDAAVCLYETGGVAPIYSMGNTAGQAVVERPRVQVVVRGEQYGYEAARAIAQKAWLLLDKLPSRTINATRYLWGSCAQSPFLMQVDEQGRPWLAFNADLMKDMSSTS